MKAISFHLHDDKVAKLLIVNFAMLPCHKNIKNILQIKIVAHAGRPWMCYLPVYGKQFFV